MRLCWPVTLLLLASCSAPPAPELREPGPPACEGGIASPAFEVHREAVVTGPSPNSVRLAGDDFWIVESGSNTVTRVDTATGASELTVDIGNERSPWDIWVGPERIWVTNFLADTVTVADRETGEIVAELQHDDLDGPAGITGTDRWVYVGNTAFRGDNEYGPGTVTIFDRATLEPVGTRTMVGENPQFLATIDEDVWVVATGAIVFDAQGARAGSAGYVERYRPSDEPMTAPADVVELPLVDDAKIGIPGLPVHQAGSDDIYFPSGTAPVVFVLDRASMQWRRGSDDPIRLYDTEQDALHHATMGPDGVLYLTAFNRDELFLVDTRCDEVLGDPISLDGSELLGGPHGLVVLPTEEGVDAWVALSLASEMVRVRLDFDTR